MRTATEMARAARALRDERAHREQEEATAQLDKLELFLVQAIRAPGYLDGTEDADGDEVVYTGPLNRLALHTLQAELGYGVKDVGDGVATAWRISWKRAPVDGSAEAEAAEQAQEDGS